MNDNEDVISMYKKMHNLDDEWEKNTRKSIDELNNKQNKDDVVKYSRPKYDHPSTPDDGFVIILYIVCMVASMIFKDFLMIWAVLTIAFVKFITRHKED